METYIFKCEGCGGQKPYLIYEAEMAEIDGDRFRVEGLKFNP